MTREEAIKLLFLTKTAYEIIANYAGIEEKHEIEALNMAIEALSAEAVHNDGRNNIKRYPNCKMRTSLGNCDAIGGFCTSVNEVICDAFHKLAEAAQDWVPCSKGLPKYRETVFLTKRDGNVDIGWRDGIKEDGTDDWFELVLSGATCAIWNITAWMPRPEPYKGGDSE